MTNTSTTSVKAAAAAITSVTLEGKQSPPPVRQPVSLTVRDCDWRGWSLTGRPGVSACLLPAGSG